ncbi:MAG: hypothetical protein ABI178_07385 [Rhodanobacter sp.]
MNKYFARCFKRLLPLGLAALAAGVLLVPAVADATPYVVKLVQQGSNVVGIGSGAIDLTGLTPMSSTGVVSASDGVWPSVADVSIGQIGAPLTAYSGITGPSSFGSGGAFFVASGNGDYVELFGLSGSYPCCGLTGPLISVQADYASGTAISNNMILANQSLASLGVTPGTYVWTWGRGAEQSFTLDIVATPEPTALGIFGFGVLLIGAFVGVRRRVV